MAAIFSVSRSRSKLAEGLAGVSRWTHTQRWYLRRDDPDPSYHQVNQHCFCYGHLPRPVSVPQEQRCHPTGAGASGEPSQRADGSAHREGA